MDPTNSRRIVITGSNKGIGYGIVEGLLKENNDDLIILTSRSKDLGQKSIDELKEKYLSNNSENRLVYHQLDIDDENSRKEFVSWVKTTYGTITHLVNNAGIFEVTETKLDVKYFETTVSTNFFNTIFLTTAMLDENLITSQIVMISSGTIRFMKFEKTGLKEKFDEAIKSYEGISSLYEEIKSSIIDNTFSFDNMPTNYWGVTRMDRLSHFSYVMSKYFLTNYTKKILTKNQKVVDGRINVFSCCPGWVATDMGNKAGTPPKTLEEGVITPLWIINQKEYNETLHGEFIEDCALSTYTS